MKKIFILLLIVLLTTIVQLNAQEWSGTGFALNRGYIVTNYHVVKDAQTIKVSGISGSFNVSYRAVVVATDKVNDVAIIKISDSKFKGFGTLPYRVTMQMAEVGDDIFVLGYPLTQTMGDEIKLTNGIISARTGFMGDMSLYQMSAPIQPGNSGGPMFDSKGNVVGIVCASHDKAENVGYAIKTSYLENLAESASLSGIFPTNNTVASLPLSGKVKSLKKFVFQIHCSNPSVSSSSGGNYSSPTSRQNFTETAYGINMDMIWVEGGSFLMGCTSEQGNDCEDDEKNVRRVTLDGFYIGMLEVTQSQWEAVMGTSVYQQRNKGNPDWSMAGVGSDYPMYYVSWNEAMEFCRLLSNKTGRTYTLPTEAQWEYAARGGSRNEGTKYAGSNMLDAVGWYSDNSWYGVVYSNEYGTHRCGTKRGNALGIYDMSGNVYEWCKDWYSSSYTSYDTNNPVGPSSGSFRVYRGGSWSSNARICRVAYRSGDSPSNRDYLLGFRVVLLP